MADVELRPVSGFDIGAAVAKALGLKGTRHIVIDIPLQEAVTITVEYSPSAQEVAPLAGILQRYRLLPRPPEPLDTEMDRLRAAAAVFEEYGVSVTTQLQQVLRERMR
jgi:hypothetical protein